MKTKREDAWQDSVPRNTSRAEQPAASARRGRAKVDPHMSRRGRRGPNKRLETHNRHGEERRSARADGPKQVGAFWRKRG